MSADELNTPVMPDSIRCLAGLAVRATFRHRGQGLLDRCMRTNGYGPQHEHNGRDKARSRIRAGGTFPSASSITF